MTYVSQHACFQFRKNLQFLLKKSRRGNLTVSVANALKVYATISLLYHNSGAHFEVNIPGTNLLETRWEIMYSQLQNIHELFYLKDIA